MKPAAFDLVRPASLAEALAALVQGGKILAGGQSLGPMLNLRVVQPGRLVQVNHLIELTNYGETPEAITLGACVTHAAIATGRTPDLPGKVLASVAGAIAYQAVRNRGTIGGSLSHADPAADWPTVLLALDATIMARSDAGRREIAMADFIQGPYLTALAQGEILTSVRIPRPSAGVQWGYVKACRKPGEFAHAMAAVLAGPVRRLAIGAMGGKPLLLTGADASLEGARAALAAAPELDEVDRHRQAVVVHRALVAASCA
jgi:carbon-monoxide dehydrogenase medium subunit